MPINPGFVLENSVVGFTNDSQKPTALDFGPAAGSGGQQLYVATQKAGIFRYDVSKASDGTWVATEVADATLNGIITAIPNHTDAGAPAGGTRQITGMIVTDDGAGNPVIYVTSSNATISVSGDSNLDTNSGILSKLTFDGQSWDKVDLVRGLPRSEENHSTNGLDLTADGKHLLVAQGGNTNQGAPGDKFSFTPEYQLSGTILKIDLELLDALPVLVDDGQKYVFDQPTLDDPTVENVTDGVGEDAFGFDEDGPFGGNDGRNQAILGSVVDPRDGQAKLPVSIYDSGYRNQYDVEVMTNGDVWVFDNGPNGGWGGSPVDANDKVTGTSGAGDVSNRPNESSSTGSQDHLHFATPGAFAGSVNPTIAQAGDVSLWEDPQVYVYDNNGVNDLDELDDRLGWSNAERQEAETAIQNQGGSQTSALQKLIRQNYDKAGSIWYGALKVRDEYLDGNGNVIKLTEMVPDASNSSKYADVGFNLGYQVQSEAQVFVKAPNGLGTKADGSFLSIGGSTNGLAEYTAPGPLKGSLLVTSFNGDVYILKYNKIEDAQGNVTGVEFVDIDGNVITTVSDLPGLTLGSNPLSVAMGPEGTIWVAQHGGKKISVLVPGDPAIIDSSDDDQDGVLNKDDPFDNDADNGQAMAAGTTLVWNFDPEDSPTSPFADDLIDGLPPYNSLGFSGGWTNFEDPGAANAANLRALSVGNVLNGGVAGSAQIKDVSSGTPIGSANNHQYGLQFGLEIDPTVEKLAVRAEMINPWGYIAQPNFKQGIGLAFGPGDQKNFFAATFMGDDEIDIVNEVNDVPSIQTVDAPGLADSGQNVPITLLYEFDIDRGAGSATVDVSWTYQGGGSGSVSGIALTGAVLDALLGTYQLKGENGQLLTDDDGQPVSSGLAVTLFTTKKEGDPTVFMDFNEIVVSTADASGNYVPVARVDSTVATGFDTAITIDAASLLANDQDLDGDGLSLAGEPVVVTGNAGSAEIVNGSLVFTPNGSFFGFATVEYQITDGNGGFATASVDIDVARPEFGGTVLYRVNTGGSQIAATGGVDDISDFAWQANTGNGAKSGSGDGAGLTFANNTGNVSTHTGTLVDGPQPNPSLPSNYDLVPDYVPDAVFTTERWDPNGGPDMAYSFAVEEGTYEIRLFQRNGASGTSAAGQRVFGIQVEDQQIVDNLDLSGTYGHLAGTMFSHVIYVDDGSLDVEWTRITENATISAIEVIQLADTPSTPQISVVGAVVGEADGQVQIVFESDRTLNSDVTVDWSIQFASAFPFEPSFGYDGDYSMVTTSPSPFVDFDVLTGTYSGNFTMASGSSDWTIFVDIRNDQAVEGDETFTVLIDDVSAGAEIGDGVATVTIQDDDVADSFNGVATAGDDFSDANGNPTVVALEPGANTLVAGQDPSDLDYVTFVVPAGQQLTAINLTAYAAGAGNKTFLGLQSGTVFPDEASLTNTANNTGSLIGFLDGGTLYGDGQVGTNILGALTSTVVEDQGVPVTGLSTPLAAGAYTLWFSQNGEPSDSAFEFVTEAVPPQNDDIGAAKLEITLNGNIETSNFGANSFAITNLGNKTIAKVEIDVTDATFTDAVFDPFGGAGDSAGKPLVIDTEGPTGLIKTGETFGGKPSFGQGSIGTNYIGDGGLKGFEKIVLEFDPSVQGGFEEGEQIKFSVDMDPNSIAESAKSTLDNGALVPKASGGDEKWDVGGISGFELLGSLFTVTFEDGTTAEGRLNASSLTTQSGGRALASQESENLPVALTVNGIGAGGVGTYDDGGPQIFVNGEAGQTVWVAVAKGFIQPTENLFNDPYKTQLDGQLAVLAASAFPANNAVEVKTVEVTLTGGNQNITGAFLTGGFSFDDIQAFNFDGEDQVPLAFVASVVHPTGAEISETGASISKLPAGPVTAPIYLTYDDGSSGTPDTLISISGRTVEESGDNGSTTLIFDLDASTAIDGAVTVGFALSGASANAPSSPAQVTFDGGNATLSVTVANDDLADGDESVTVELTSVSVPSGSTVDVPLALDGSGAIATGTVTEDDSDFVPGDVLLRINAFGPELAAIDDSGVAWSADTAGSPSPYLQPFQNASQNRGDTTPGAGAGSAIDDIVPDALFQKTRSSNEPIAYEIPVADIPSASGFYKVNLYFIETYFVGENGRVFDGEIESAVPDNLDDVDTYTQFGKTDGGVISNIVEVTDGVLDIRFVQGNTPGSHPNPVISGIEIIESVGADLPTLSVAAPAAVVESGDSGTTALAFQLAVDGTLNGTVSVTFDVDIDGSTTRQTQSVNFNQAAPSLSVAVANDDVNDGNETVTVTLVSAGSAAEVNTQAASATVLEDDAVTPVNTPPVAVSDTFSGSEDSDIAGNVLQPQGATADSDADGDQIAVAEVNGTAISASGTTEIDLANGELTIAANGAFTYMPDADYFGSESFTYIASDGTDQSNTATVTIDIAGAADPALIGGTVSGTLIEDVAVGSNGELSTGGNLTVFDPDPGQAAFIAQTETGGAYGSFSLSAAGAWTYTADNGQAAIQDLDTGANLTDSFTVQAVDGTSTTVTVTINGADEVTSAMVFGEWGRIGGVGSSVQTVQLSRAYDNPVVLTSLSSTNDGRIAVARITDIDADSFNVFAEQPNALPNNHGSEELSFLVIEAGRWTLADGTVFEAGTLDTNNLTSDAFENVDFSANFPATPTVVSQVQTANGGDYVSTRQKGLSASGFDLAMEEEEALNGGGHTTETVGWLAAYQPAIGAGSFLEAGLTETIYGSASTPLDFTPGLFAAAPTLLTSIATFAGKNPAVSRQNNLSADGVDIVVQEDQTKDSETFHVDEKLAFIALAGTSGLLTTGGTVEPPAPETIGAVREVTSLTEQTQVVDFGIDLANPVVFATPPTLNGVDPASVSFTAITSSSATVFVDEPEYLDGPHPGAEDVTVLALEAGSWELADGRRLEVGTIDLPAAAGFTAVTFGESFADAPVILTQIQTDNGDTDWATVRIDSLDGDSFDVALQEEEESDGIHGPTTIGWLALETDGSSSDTFDWSGVLAQAFSTGNTVTQSGTELAFAASLGSDPLIAAVLASFNDSDTASLRLDERSGGVFAVADEETSADGETSHAPENVTGIAFTGEGTLMGVDLLLP